MPALLALTAAAAWLLLAAGAMKIRNPRETVAAIRTLTGRQTSLAEGAAGARLLGGAEAAIALGYLIWPHLITASLLGTAYLLVFGSAWVLSSRDQDCGCFGASSTRVGSAHLVVTLVGALSALGVALMGSITRDPATYALSAAAATIALGAYALIAPLTVLRTRLAELRV